MLKDIKPLWQIVIETIRLVNGHKKDNFSIHLVSNKLSTESDFKCQSVLLFQNFEFNF